MVPDDLFGIAYLDAESFRAAAGLFGVGVAMSGYPDDDTGNQKLEFALQAASRVIDSYCCRNFIGDPISEQHRITGDVWKFTVNCPPVSSVEACSIRYAIDSTLIIKPSDVYINNQEGLLEIPRGIDAVAQILSILGSELENIVAEVLYYSFEDIPPAVRSATGYQAAMMMNGGYVDANVPANFGAIDLGGMKLNNRKGSRNSADAFDGSIAPEAARLLLPYRKISVA